MSKIKVALRVRPISEREINGGFPVVLAVENNCAFVTDIRVPESPKADSRPRYRQFHFDHGFWLDNTSAGVGATQAEIYAEMGPPLEGSVLDGYNACLLAYGQSGTGKTHTMLGSKDDPGLIPRLCHNIWEKLNCDEEERSNFRMEVSFMEIYREKVRDLLNPGEGHLKLREHPTLGPHVQNLSRVEVTQEDGLLDLLWEGESRRAIGITGSNRRSSRSHAIWTIYLTREKKKRSNSFNDNDRQTTTTTITNRVHLVDLAGSEKAGFATAKNLLAEGADINRSLVALGNVISSLAEKVSYIPYRDSALTWLLKDSLGGNATTAIIITASPASCGHAPTLNSFRFAARARLVENKPRINLNLAASQLLLQGSLTANATPSAAALYSIMSAYEIKKDISKLSRIIRSAQNNGGILRGITTPRASWNRLVNALEGWNAIEDEQVKLQRERAASLEMGEGSSKDSSPSLIPSPPRKCSDATSQANFIKHSPTSLPPSPPANSRVPMAGSEVFIPLSTSIKCLTWKQEEVQTAPTDNKTTYSPPVHKRTPPGSRLSSRDLLLPVQYPVPQHLDHPSRISERIHASLSALPKGDTARLGIVPNALEEDSIQSPLIRQRIPTLVNCARVKESGKEGVIMFASSEGVIPVVPCVEESTSDFSCREMERVPCFGKMEQDDDFYLEEITRTSKMRLVHKSRQRGHTLTLKLPPIPSIFSGNKCVTFEDISEGDDGEEEMGGTLGSESGCSLSEEDDEDEAEEVSPCPEMFSSMNPIPERSWSHIQEHSDSEVVDSSSSCGSWNFSRTIPVLVKVIPEESEDKDFRLESIAEWVNDINSNPVSVSTVEVDSGDLLPESEEYPGNDGIIDPEPALPESKFRHHFSLELSQMEKIGQKLAQLKQLSSQGQRFSVVQPYLEKIFGLEEADHTSPDPGLDKHIEECSGWNVETELNLVNREMSGLCKVLKIKEGGGGVGGTDGGKSRRDSSGSGRSSTTLPSSSYTTHSVGGSGGPTSPVLFGGGGGGDRRGMMMRGGSNSMGEMGGTDRIMRTGGGKSRGSFSEGAVVAASAPWSETGMQQYDGHYFGERAAGGNYGYQQGSGYHNSQHHPHTHNHPNYNYGGGGVMDSPGGPFSRINLEYGAPHHERMIPIMEHHNYSSHQQQPRTHYDHVDQLSSCSSSFSMDHYSPYNITESNKRRLSQFSSSYGHGDHPTTSSSPFSHIFSNPSVPSTPTKTSQQQQRYSNYNNSIFQGGVIKHNNF